MNIPLEYQHLVEWIQTPAIQKLRKVARNFNGRQIVIINGTNGSWPWNYTWPRPPPTNLPPYPWPQPTHEVTPAPAKVCLDNIHEVYQDCGRKCVLGCKYAFASTTISIPFTGGKHECDKLDTNCVEGCFCKTGLIRHQGKCIPARECPIRKCHRDEIYVSVIVHPLTRLLSYIIFGYVFRYLIALCLDVRISIADHLWQCIAPLQRYPIDQACRLCVGLLLCVWLSTQQSQRQMCARERMHQRQSHWIVCTNSGSLSIELPSSSWRRHLLSAGHRSKFGIPWWQLE